MMSGRTSVLRNETPRAFALLCVTGPRKGLHPTFIATAFLALTAGCSSEQAPNQVPEGLASIESTAEDAFDLALDGDVSAVRERARDLSTDWDAYRVQATSDGVPSAAMSALDNAIEQLMTVSAGSPSEQELARATNAISEPMPSFYEVYDPAVPSQVLALDYLGREVQLDALEADFTRAGGDVDETESIWQALRDGVVSAGGKREAAAFDESISSERAAIGAGDGAALEKAAIDQLELVDGVEVVFADAGDPPD